MQEALGADVIMALDVCPSFQDSPGEGQGGHRTDPQMGAKVSKCPQAARSSPLWYHTGGIQSGVACGVRPRYFFARFSRLCDRRSEPGRTQRIDPADARNHSSRFADRQAPLFDGCRYARRHSRRRESGNRYVRLCSAHPGSPQRRPLHRRRQTEYPQRRLEGRSRPRSTRLAAAIPAGIFPPPICTIFSGRRNCWPTPWPPFTTCNLCIISWRG